MVYLIGVGPGDEELITLKAIKTIKKADVILYDRLINPNILRYAKNEAEIVYCGKESGKHTKTQQEINDLIVKYAKEGKVVARLKGGDPYVFGRGGEEALRLVEEGIDFEVIPGVTSAIAALNYAGIPITHRGIAQSFHVVTGKSANNLNVNYKALAKEEGTLVFLMGIEEIESIVEKLIENGKDENTPCAVIHMGTTKNQRVCLDSLKNIVYKVKEENIKSPSIIVVGDVVSLRNKLNWYEKKPLFGKRICITRPKNRAFEIKNKILELGGEVFELPTIKINKIKDYDNGFLNRLSEYSYVIFTSVNGVEIFFDELIENGIDIRKLNGQVLSIGPKTNEELKKRGIMATCADEYTQEGIFEKLKHNVKSGDKILIPRAKGARKFLVDELRDLGAIVDEVNIYESIYEEKYELIDCDIYVFTSTSTVNGFIKLYGTNYLRGKKVVAIGPITAQTLKENGVEATMADKYTVDGIIDKILGGI
ncbi:MAG: uroporphyrinogen-III C-methyltransferase [Clostridiales bacterium]|nr:uroporphyrinogen-III C-methyltransferase [Clostridiales bacterium]